MADTKTPRAEMAMKDFAGLINNADPRDLPPGTAQVQVNINSRTSGELNVRRGLREVRFEG
jgi:hypothetical protein